MHIYFSGIGGTGIGSLAMIAKQAGYEVSGSDKQDSDYIQNLKKHGITDITIGQTEEKIATLHQKNAIDWFVYSSAVAIENPKHPELEFCRQQGIKMSKRDELLNLIIKEKQLRMIAVAGTHGKTTTTAMAIWLMKELGLPVSYSVGAKMSFGDMGQFDSDSKFFVYECDEYDRNFLAFKPALSIITGIAWDHADIYPTEAEYQDAFRDFIDQSEHVVMWQSDQSKLKLTRHEKLLALNENAPDISHIKLPGLVNRKDAWQVICALHSLSDKTIEQCIEIMNRFPGVSRRFERIAENIYSDYAHTPEKIAGALQLAHEVAGENIVVVYEGLHNTRQHFIKDQLSHLFDSAKQLYVVPSYLAREDKNLDTLTPEDLIKLTSQTDKATASELNPELKNKISHHAEQGDLVLCLSAGGGGSLDEWLRKQFAS